MIVSSKSHFLAVSLLQCRRALCECLLVRQICHNILSFHSVSGGGKTATVDLLREKPCRDGGNFFRLCTVNLECEFEKHNFRQVRIFVGIFSVRVDDDWRWKQKERTRVSIWIFVFLSHRVCAKIRPQFVPFIIQLDWKRFDEAWKSGRVAHWPLLDLFCSIATATKCRLHSFNFKLSALSIYHRFTARRHKWKSHEKLTWQEHYQ